MLAAVLFSGVFSPGESFSKYEEWLLSLQSDDAYKSSHSAVVKALEDLLPRQTPLVINSNIKVSLHPALKARADCKRYVQGAKQFGAKLPSEASTRPADSPERLVEAWRVEFDRYVAELRLPCAVLISRQFRETPA